MDPDTTAPPRRLPALLAAGVFAGALTVVVMRLGNLEFRVQNLERVRGPLRAPLRAPLRGRRPRPRPDTDGDSSDSSDGEDAAPPTETDVPKEADAAQCSPDTSAEKGGDVILEDNVGASE